MSELGLGSEDLRPVGPRGRAWLGYGVALGLLLALGCTRPNPDYCEKEDDSCGAGRYCDTKTKVCRPGSPPNPGRTGGNGGGGGGIEGSGRGGTGGGSGGEMGMGGDAGDAGDGGDGDGPVLPLGTCNVDSDCPEGTKICENKKCVACRVDTQATNCDPNSRPFCSPSTGMCVSCKDLKAELTKEVCTAPTQYCDEMGGTCSECTESMHCMDAKKPICTIGALMKKSCAACMVGAMGDAACKAKNPMLPICLMGGACAECGKHSDCTKPGALACIANKCAPCTTDEHCKGEGPGVCITDPDGKNGRCATEAETIYVKRGGTCGGATAKGDAAMPFCKPADAAKAITAMRRVMVLRGPEALEELTISGAGAEPIWIIGQDNAAITAVPPGITLRSSDVRIRNLTVQSGGAAGIVAQDTAIVRLNRCLVKGNAKGGLLVDGGAGFDIVNTVFDGNGGAVVGASTFGGVFLGRPTGNRPKRFRFNTILTNMGPGVTCADMNQEVTASLLYANGFSDLANCKKAGGTRDGEQPNLVADYHLTAGSPCVNKVAVGGDQPPDDRDGDQRPQMGQLDCGADEFKP
jgi:hypothetical protein